MSFRLRAEAQQNLRQSGFDLSAEEWALMMVLWKKGPTPMAQLAEITLRDRTTVTRLVDRLIVKKLVQRGSVKPDRRKVIISVTAKGDNIKPAVMAAMLPLIKKSNAGISEPELAQAMDVLMRMAKNLDA
ncbi:MAG: MarR family transcriptional regulator [Paracoccaceae bacterium]